MGAKDTMKNFFTAMNEQVVPSRGYGSKIISTPMGPFSWNDHLGVWVNTNNGMQLNNISFQDMFAMMDYSSLGSGDSNVVPVFIVFGSNAASTFLRDAIAGNDSVDFITLGDSNSGQCGGWQYGWESAFRVKVNPFGTPILFTKTTDTTASSTVLTGYPIGGFMVGTGISLGIPYYQGYFSGITLGRLSTATDAPGVSLYTSLGFTTAAINTLKPCGFTYDASYLPTGVTFSSFANTNYIEITQQSTLINSSVLEYRLVHGLFTQSGGQFRPILYGNTAGVGSGLLKQFTTTSTAGGAEGITTSGFTFGGSSTLAWFRTIFDNGGQGTPIKGPFSSLWHSIIAKSVKGVVVSNLSYYGGRTTTEISNEAAVYNNNIVKYFLKECYERQKSASATNSGRVIVWINSGINDTPDTGTSWTTGINNIVSTMQNIWTSGLSYPAANLAFITSITHPTQSSANGGNTFWYSNRASFTTAAKTFVQGSTGSSCNVSYIELNDVYGADTLKSLNYYLSDGLAQAHLVTAGYTAYAGNMLTSLLSY